MKTYDVIVIGGGFLGVSTAYHLARTGARTLLLEAGDIGSGTSGSCSGRAQVCEGHLDPLNIFLVREGLARHNSLEEELGFDYEWRRAGLFLLLPNEESERLWRRRCEVLSAEGIPTQIVDCATLRAAEPFLRTEGLVGAVYASEGTLNPLRFVHAYAQAAMRCGADVRRNSPVIGMDVQGSKVLAVHTAQEVLGAGAVAVMAGAWESVVTSMAGVDTPITHTHAEAFVTESIPAMIHNNIGVADSYDTIYGKERGVAIGIVPEVNGTLVISEAVTRTDELHQRTSAWGLEAMATQSVRLFPFLEKVRVMRTWGRPTSIAPDEEPVVGWLPQLDNLFVATSLLETISALPVLSEWMAMMIQGQEPPMALDLYSPARFWTR